MESLGGGFWYTSFMKFRINHRIFEDFDKPVIGVIIAKGISNKNNNPQIQKLLRGRNDYLLSG